MCRKIMNKKKSRQEKHVQNFKCHQQVPKRQCAQTWAAEETSKNFILLIIYTTGEKLETVFESYIQSARDVCYVNFQVSIFNSTNYRLIFLGEGSGGEKGEDKSLKFLVFVKFQFLRQFGFNYP